MIHPQRMEPEFVDSIELFTVEANWNGGPLTLHPQYNVNMPQTSNGSMIFACENLSPGNDQGEISLTSGGGSPISCPAPAGANQPSFLIQNWQANNLSVTNESRNGDTPIWIEAVGPGIPGVDPGVLPNDGSSVTLPAAQPGQALPSLVGDAQPRSMQLVFQSNSADLALFALIGGPLDGSGNNGYVFAVNASENTGPGTGELPPPGYYATTTGNRYTFPLGSAWGSARMFVANMSGSTSVAATVSLGPA